MDRPRTALAAQVDVALTSGTQTRPDRNENQDEHGKNNQRKNEFRQHTYQACDRQAVVGVSALTGAQRAAGGKTRVAKLQLS
jgi:hypothetical protein